MSFLIEYNRNEGRIASIKSFKDSERTDAQDSLLELELNLKGMQREVVLLEAASEEAVRRTHRRYFETLAELTSVPANW
ncbi:MAG TPA: hypothetical protein VK117_02545 [Pyrinomonadaceae bacterium]|nr:hypothetical protein [Pyrinomonadaceae bacterium]